MKIDITNNEHHCRWLTISIVFLSAGVYTGISSFSILGLIGFLCLNLFLGILVESSLYKMDIIMINNTQGILLVVTSVVYFLLSIINSDFSARLGVLSVFSTVVLLILMWAAFKNVNERVEQATILLIFLGGWFAANYIWQNLGAFTADSFSYYEISETIGRNYGKIGTIRQYIVKTDYNISFPYFYPFCIFMIDKITGLGRYSGVLFNVYVTIITSVLFLFFSRKFVGKKWCAGIAIFVLITAESYLDEVCSARSIPLAVLLSALAGFFLIDGLMFNKEKISRFLLAGCAGGLLISTRFDGMIMVAYSVFLLIIFRKNIRKIFSYILGVIITSSPWIIYSCINFGRLWITDNSGTAFLVWPTVPTRIIIPGDGTLTLFNAPKEWFSALFQKASSIIGSLSRCSYMADICILICVFFFIVAFIKKNMSKQAFGILFFTVLLYAGKTAMFILVGYADVRYHVETVVFVVFSFLLMVEYIGILKLKSCYVVALIIVGMVLTIFDLRGVGYVTFTSANSNMLSKIEIAPQWVVQLNEELIEKVENQNDEILFLGDGYTFGGWTDWKIYANPESNEWTKIQYAMDNYMDVEHVLILKEHENQDIILRLGEQYARTELSDYYLFSVKGE